MLHNNSPAKAYWRYCADDSLRSSQSMCLKCHTCTVVIAIYTSRYTVACMLNIIILTPCTRQFSFHSQSHLPTSLLLRLYTDEEGLIRRVCMRIKFDRRLFWIILLFSPSIGSIGMDEWPSPTFGVTLCSVSHSARISLLYPHMAVESDSHEAHSRSFLEHVGTQGNQIWLVCLVGIREVSARTPFSSLDLNI